MQLVREHGGDGIAFDSIVASGAAGALPHAEPRREPIAPGSLVSPGLPGILSNPVATRMEASSSSADSGRTRARSNQGGKACVPGPWQAS